jgi:2-enoate reductase
LIPGSQPSSRAEIGRLLQYWREEVVDSETELRLNTEVTRDLVRQESPHALVVAVTAVSIVRLMPGIEIPYVIAATEALLNVEEIAGQKAVALGGGDVGCECAVFLSHGGCEVTIVAMQDGLLLSEEVDSIRADLLQMVQDDGTKALAGAQGEAIGPQGVPVRLNDGSEQTVEMGVEVLAVGLRPLSEVAHQLAGECSDVRVIGDCQEPRRVREAAVEADQAARLI